MDLQTVKANMESYLAQKKIFDDSLAEFVAENCPWKVGQTTEITGYYHTGKAGKITDISPAYDNQKKRIGFAVRWQVLKKDKGQSTYTAHDVIYPSNWR